MADILRGAPVAQEIDHSSIQKVSSLQEEGIIPKLAVVRIGDKDADRAYERSIVKRCEKTGLCTQPVPLPGDITQESLIGQIHRLNVDRSVHGVLLFRPLPMHINETVVRNALAPEKDVDGITDISLSGVFSESGQGFTPCTAQACLEMLDYYGITMKGKRAVIIGRSLVVGKPVAMLLLARHATVSICHTRTQNLPEECRRADILIVSAGRPHTLGADCFSRGQTVLDVGVNILPDGGMCGDIDFTAAALRVASVTPVPGGVGSVTTSVLISHLVDAASKIRKGN